MKYIIPTLLLIFALCLSSMSAYYSIVGLTLIFAGGMYGFIFMECAKIAITLFLHKHWNDSIGILKQWLTISVMILALITSMGVFGYLSKASTKNSENVTVNSSKIVFLEDSISREKNKMDMNLKQIDTYNQSMSKLITDNPLRASGERKRLQKEISILSNDNKLISQSIDKLNQELLPYKSELKQHEVEIGPLLYITKLIYGQDYKKYSDKTLTNLILIIVLVFDPLAIAMLIASQKGYLLIKDKPKNVVETETNVAETTTVAEPVQQNNIDIKSPTFIDDLDNMIRRKRGNRNRLQM